MTDQDQKTQGGFAENSQASDSQMDPGSNKRPFVAPEISQPVDVLEATTFFQAVDSGATS